MSSTTPVSLHAGQAWKCITAPSSAWGASPFWDPQQERLYWVDSVQERIWRLHLPSGRSDLWQLTQAPGSLAPCRSGALLMAMRNGILLSASWQDVPQQIAVAPYDPVRQRFHGGQCDPWGRFWVGTRAESGEQAIGGLYCLRRRDRPHPELLQVASGVVESCGLAWSPDGRRLYWGDGQRGWIDTHALPSAGQYPPVLANAQPFWRRQAAEPADGATLRPQGAAVDRLGRYWVALLDGGCLLCLDPQGQLLARIPTPVQRPTGLCFGGTDLRTLFLTTARSGLDAQALKRHPDSGAVFALRVEVPGLPVNRYED
ncbi:SMP-30/gluconolactonase/LRE family protein [Malikia granosa]|uniref:Gluconolactonase n=1 Tax=Malikia granosa TaxID=263067 RepID=A0A2S9K3H2_9BURK|nr:SMP-30/gluconolactonase/LRE family protein [Malikia granosa]PRD65028.1 gluconolactonase [Malikia granosa]